MNYRLEAIYESMYTREGESAAKMHSTKRNSTMNKNWQLEAVYEKIIEQTLIPERLDVKGYKSKKDVAQAITNNNPNFKIGSTSPDIRIQPVNKELAKDKENLKKSLIDSLDDINLVLIDTLQPQEPGNPSSKFNAYKVKDTISDNEFIVVISGGSAANKGMTFERDILESFKVYFNKLEQAETDEEKKQIEKPSMIEKLEDNLNVKFIGVDNNATFTRQVKRPLTASGANDKGKEIADVTLSDENGNPYFISLKDIGGKTVGNAGAARMFDIKDNKVDFINKERDEIGGKLMKAAGIHIPAVERGLSDYYNKTVSPPELAEIINTTDQADKETLHKFIESAFDYGYIYVKRKSSKNDLEIEDLSDRDRLVDFIGDITKVQVKYPFYQSDAKGRKSISIIMTTDKNIYSFDIRNAGGKVLPDQINLVKLGSKAELKTAATSVAKVDTKDKQLTNLLNK